MTTKTINLYTLDELPKEAKEKAHSEWVENNGYYFLSDYLNERLHELLDENNIKDTNDTSKPGTTPTPVHYSLSHCQGDGAMFQGVFEWNGYEVRIKQSGFYYHSNSKNIEIIKSDAVGVSIASELDNEASEDVYRDFDIIYQKICKKLERYGYGFIEYEDSFECFEEVCNANNYTFTEDGTMENE